MSSNNNNNNNNNNLEKQFMQWQQQQFFKMLSGQNGSGMGNMSGGNGVSGNNGVSGTGFNGGSNSLVNSMGPMGNNGLDLPKINYGPSIGSGGLGGQYHPYNKVAKEFSGEDSSTSSLLKGT